MHKPTPPHPASPHPAPPCPTLRHPALPPTPTPRPTTPSQGDTIKKGQTVAYVEQLGTFVAIEAPQAGEVARFLLNEGDAVEYGQDVLELAPFFGGHIIGDSKHA
jgi:multidrug efflux pump subunit AcrA (membrane-fusion protein)